MILRSKILGIEAGGKPIIILNKEDAEDLGIRSLSRVRLQFGGKSITCIVNTTTTIVKRGEVCVYEEVRKYLGVKENDEVEVEVASFPSSLTHIRNKLKGRKLNYEEIYEIVKDVVEGNLSESEIASFVTALHTIGLDLDEATSLALSMVETGEKLRLNRIVLDKHSIGGVVGDKTTLILVPTIASLGFTIPKTSSRAITSYAGSADKAEVLMPVVLDLEEMKSVVNKTNGCIVWGGSLHLAPADDVFIQIEYPLSIDPLLLPSIMSKKRSVGANYLVIDIPCGRGTKVKTIGDATILAKDFIELGERLNIKTQCAITYGEQPIGYAIGPALEAKEALEVLMGKKIVPDLIDKVVNISHILLGMIGKDGKTLAIEAIKSRKAEKKMREIIFEQGGDSEVKPEDIKIGDYGLDFYSEEAGMVLWINQVTLTEVARALGSPKDKGAGILLHKKLWDNVKKGEKLFTLYAEKTRKLERARKILEEEKVFGVGKKIGMLIQEVKELPVHKKLFLLER